MKKYKHVKTGNISQDYIPSWVLEGSSEWVLIRPPLFKTEDEIEIYEGDKVFYVTTYFLLLPITIKNDFFYDTCIKIGCKFFSSEAAASNYIKFNKPQYSLKHLINLIDKLK